MLPENIDLDWIIEGWNLYFESRPERGADVVEPLRSYILLLENRTKHALVNFLTVDRKALDDLEQETFKECQNLRSSYPHLEIQLIDKPGYSYFLFSTRLGVLSNIKGPFGWPINDDPLIGLWCNSRILMLELADRKIPILICPQCEKLFLKKDGHQKYCSKECQRKTSSIPTNTSDYRTAYRRVYMQFKRMTDSDVGTGGYKKKDAVEKLLRDEPYSRLIDKYSIPVKNWITEKGDRHGS